MLKGRSFKMGKGEERKDRVARQHQWSRGCREGGRGR